MSTDLDLPKTWFIDIDGVIFPHNGYLNLPEGGFEKPLPGVLNFFKKIPKGDIVILCTARKEIYREITEYSLNKAGINYKVLLMELNTGVRVLINDKKNNEMITAYSINLKRNSGLDENEIKNVIK